MVDLSQLELIKTARDVVDEVGLDQARAYLMRPTGMPSPCLRMARPSRTTSKRHAQPPAQPSIG